MLLHLLNLKHVMVYEFDSLKLKGPVNSNAKWQRINCEKFLSRGLEHVYLVNQLFVLREKGDMLLLEVNIADNIILTETYVASRNYINGFG